jgi:Bacteriophage tail sheath protein
VTQQLLSSKVVVREEEPRVRGIPSAPTSVAGMVGVTERGPIAQAVLCTSIEEVRRSFGGFTPQSDLLLAALGFFENGGSHLWVVRTVHFGNIADPASTTAVRATGALLAPGAPTPATVEGTVAAPLHLKDGDVLLLSVGGAPALGATFYGQPAMVQAAGAAPFGLADGQTLTLLFDDGEEQTVAFSTADFADIAAATPEELAAVINAQVSGAKALADAGVLGLASDTEGTASLVHVIGGDANAVLDFPTGPVGGTGNVADLNAVTIAEIKTHLETALPAVTGDEGAGGVVQIQTVDVGQAATLQVDPSTAAAFGLDGDLHTGNDAGATPAVLLEGKDPGGYANHVEVEVRPPVAGDPDTFDMLIIEDGSYRESFPGVSLDPGSPRHIDKVVNDPRSGSVLIRVTDQELPGHPVPPAQTAQLTGGDDGLTGLDDLDFIGDEEAKTGLRALDRLLDLAVLAVPGRATPAVQQSMVHYCEIVRSGMVFAVLDPPAAASAARMVQHVELDAGLLELTEYAAIYWPRVQILNPDKASLGATDRVVAPPSGIIAGVFARNDGARPGGIYDPPAGVDNGRMYGVVGFETDEVLEETKRDLLYPKRINPLTTGPGMPRFIDGSRTLKASGNFPYVAERRGVIFIERSLKQGLQFARHKNNTEGLRAQVRRTITAFLNTQMQNGAFRSREQAKAFFVDVSDALNTAAVIFAGKLIVRVGLATNKPAEFIEILLSQDTRALEAALAGV